MNGLEKWLIPPVSVLSGLPGEWLDLTAAEQRALLRPVPSCPVCGEASPDGKVCGSCLVQPPAYHASRLGFRYEMPISLWIKRFKYHRDLSCGSLLAQLFVREILDGNRYDLLMNQGISWEEVDCLLPVPIHVSRYRQRGFNQAEVLAKVIGRELDIPVKTGVITRVINTESQTELSQAERQKNVSNAFVMDENALNGVKSVAIVDDVMTTGATVDEIARLIRSQAEIKRIEAWAIAKK